ncbi:hypothetical protein PPERSA_09838 [Pseudocohnilembus persalinus]|uniref:Uncharacterized protein n=1 Tax=Pseudocohnilembus persalinus TaxID=266149 RepID=A0A0V0QTW8_PSEPJ|nr:hypothetical protein PPERSA_09838 [Pseudocohnilembus persalinus]|eukprot:KRX05698.1 hypothetical protein PPERSA_09838 [Pseudocohnilembus persalinus]
MISNFHSYNAYSRNINPNDLNNNNNRQEYYSYPQQPQQNYHSDIDQLVSRQNEMKKQIQMQIQQQIDLKEQQFRARKENQFQQNNVILARNVSNFQNTEPFSQQKIIIENNIKNGLKRNNSKLQRQNSSQNIVRNNSRNNLPRQNSSKNLLNDQVDKNVYNNQIDYGRINQENQSKGENSNQQQQNNKQNQNLNQNFTKNNSQLDFIRQQQQFLANKTNNKSLSPYSVVDEEQFQSFKPFEVSPNLNMNKDFQEFYQKNQNQIEKIQNNHQGENEMQQKNSTPNNIGLKLQKNKSGDSQNQNDVSDFQIEVISSNKQLQENSNTSNNKLISQNQQNINNIQLENEEDSNTNNQLNQTFSKTQKCEKFFENFSQCIDVQFQNQSPVKYQIRNGQQIIPSPEIKKQLSFERQKQLYLQQQYQQQQQKQTSQFNSKLNTQRQILAQNTKNRSQTVFNQIHIAENNNKTNIDNITENKQVSKNELYDKYINKLQQDIKNQRNNQSNENQTNLTSNQNKIEKINSQNTNEQQVNQEQYPQKKDFKIKLKQCQQDKENQDPNISNNIVASKAFSNIKGLKFVDNNEKSPQLKNNIQYPNKNPYLNKNQQQELYEKIKNQIQMQQQQQYQNQQQNKNQNKDQNKRLPLNNISVNQNINKANINLNQVKINQKKEKLHLNDYNPSKRVQTQPNRSISLYSNNQYISNYNLAKQSKENLEAKKLVQIRQNRGFSHYNYNSNNNQNYNYDNYVNYLDKNSGHHFSSVNNENNFIKNDSRGNLLTLNNYNSINTINNHNQDFKRMRTISTFNTSSNQNIKSRSISYFNQRNLTSDQSFRNLRAPTQIQQHEQNYLKNVTLPSYKNNNNYNYNVNNYTYNSNNVYSINNQLINNYSRNNSNLNLRVKNDPYLQRNAYKGFQPKPTKIKSGAGVQFSKFLLAGLSYAIFDKASEYFFGQKGDFSHYYEKYHLKKQMQRQKQNEDNQKETENKQLKYSVGKVKQQIQQQEGFQEIEQIKKQQDIIPKPEKNTILHNFVYGFIIGNLGNQIQSKVHLKLLKNQMSPNLRIAIISPSSFIPYYFIMGMNHQLSISDILQKLVWDAPILLGVRLLGDYLLYFKIPQIQTVKTHINQTNMEQYQI